MKKSILIAGAAAFAFGAQASAKPGNAHGMQGNAHAEMTHGKAHAGETGRNEHATSSHGKHVVTTRNGGRPYALGRRGSCPPGLAKTGNGCMPPGQAKKYYSVGQRYNRNFGTLWSYSQIPYDLRSRYNFDQNGRFYYRNGYLYQVDPRTLLVEQAVSLILR